jgi:hypothetical protein
MRADHDSSQGPSERACHGGRTVEAPDGAGRARGLAIDRDSARLTERGGVLVYSALAGAQKRLTLTPISTGVFVVATSSFLGCREKKDHPSNTTPIYLVRRRQSRAGESPRSGTASFQPLDGQRNRCRMVASSAFPSLSALRGPRRVLCRSATAPTQATAAYRRGTSLRQFHSLLFG